MKTQILFLTIFFCFLASSLKAQTDTVYFNEDWDTCVKKEAYYTRILKKDLKGLAVVDYYPNEKIKMTGTYDIDSPKKKQGYFKYFTDDGYIEIEVNFVNNREDGLYKNYEEKGIPWLEQEMTNGQNNGELKTYFANGTIKRIEHYKNGEFVDGKCFATTGADTTFYPFKEISEFIGGESELYKFIRKNLKYPKAARKAKAEGTVIIHFAVDIDGSLTDIKLHKRGNTYLDNEAIRVVSLSPKWKPGKLEGKITKLHFTIPIKFVL